MRSKILVTGADGQLGSEIRVASAEYEEYDFTFLSRKDLSIHDEVAIKNLFESVKPQYCINCAAYTAVDRAESEKEQAFLINGAATGFLAAACNVHDAKFVHLSTDYVFNGNATQPYTEEDAVDPVNLYGESKLEGEDLAFKNNYNSLIIRTSWVYSSFGNNFVKTMIRLMKERNVLGVVDDQFGSPTYAADLARAIFTIVQSEQWKAGIYHYSNEGIISWYNFAVAIKKSISSACQVNPILTASYPTPAKRPAYSVFSKQKIKDTYNVTIPEWEESLRRCIEKILES